MSHWGLLLWCKQLRTCVNPWDIGCPDLAGGGREDGLATLDRRRKLEQGKMRDGVMKVWRKGKE